MKALLSILILLFATDADAQLTMGRRAGGTAINGFTYCRQIKIDHTKHPNTAIPGPTTYPNFPVPIRSAISPTLQADLRTIPNGGVVTSTDGFDIVFYPDALGGAGGAKLNHKIKKYDPVTGEFSVYLRQSLSAAVDATPHICYGKSSITTSQEANVFDSQYQSFYSFDDVGGGPSPLDSTANAVHGKIGGAVTLVPGKLDGAVHFTASGTGVNKINFGNSNVFWDLSSVTIGFWYHLDTKPTFVGGSPTSEHDEFTFFSLNNGSAETLRISVNDVPNFGGNGVLVEIKAGAAGTATLPELRAPVAGDTKFIVVRHDVPNHKLSLFINGAIYRSYDFYPPVPDTYIDFTIGSMNYSVTGVNSGMDGWLDELWITNTAESDDFIKNMYLMQNNPALMVIVGPRL